MARQVWEGNIHTKSYGIGLNLVCADNITSRFKDDGGHIKMALQALESSIAEFNDEAVFFSQLRLGRIEENGLAVKLDTKNIRAVVDNNSHRLVGKHSAHLQGV